MLETAQSRNCGLNIIRGENGSGKSTISDFIFYVLGGEFDRWKPTARLCSEVQAEVETAGGVLTIKRPIGEKTTKPEVLFSTFDDAMSHGLDGWQRYPLHRQETQESFSQVIFRSSGIPEAISQGTSNITMHQLLRLMYSDQRTAPGFLFRYEDWDNDLSPEFPPVLRRVLGLMFGLMRPAFPVPVWWRTRWA